jgi:DNA-binding transcriptional MocR family regulator
VRKSRTIAWKPELRVQSGAVYLAIVDAIAEDIQSGRLSTADRLPPQRELARALDVNYATVSRAYGEAQRRGLIYARVGRGSFVCKPRPAAQAKARGLVDMTMNLPPEPEDAAIAARLARGVEHVTTDLREHLRYQEFGGSERAKETLSQWLRRTVHVPASPDRLLVCPGAQSALLATLNALAKPGDVVLCEQLTYPGVRALCAQLGIRLIGLPMDDEGVSSEAFEAACAEYHPKLLYLNPTLQNPTTCTISAARRRELVRVARTHGIAILEDDAYGMLPTRPHEAFATLAPELTYYVTGFAKCLGAGLRVGMLLAPDARRAARLSTILRATTVMASPLSVALVTRWVDDGSAEAVLLAIRAESIARQKLVTRLLPRELVRTDPEAFHVWLTLPPHWQRSAFASHMRAQGVPVVVSDGFAVGEPSEAVRLCLGGSADRSDVKQALELIADALQGEAHGEAAFF